MSVEDPGCPPWPRTRVRGRHYFAVWMTEYPEEGAELCLAVTEAEAKKRAAKWFEMGARRLTATRMKRSDLLARAKYQHDEQARWFR